MSVPRPAMLVAIVTIPKATRLGHNFRFALVILGVQYNVLDALPLQDSRKYLRLFNRRGTHQHWLILVVEFRNLICYRVVLFLLRPEHDVWILNSPHHLVRRDHNDFELVDFVEFRCFRFGGTRHAGELWNKAGSNSGK